MVSYLTEIWGTICIDRLTNLITADAEFNDVLCLLFVLMSLDLICILIFLSSKSVAGLLFSV